MKKYKNLIVFILIFVFISLIFNSIQKFYTKSVNLTYNDFITSVEKGKVSQLNLTDSSKLQGKLKDGSKFTTDNPRTQDFKEYLLKKNVRVTEGNSISIVQILLSMLLILALTLYLLKKGLKQPQNIFNMSSIGAKSVENTAIKFENVAGNEEAKESIKELIDFIKFPEKFSHYGARMPRGVILYGPPGTGKTLLARALAGEAGVPFYAVSGSDFVQMYVGVGAARIRDLFKKAKQHKKCVIFIDEIDALGKKRDSGLTTGGNDERDQTLNALLSEMSGFSGNDGIIVIAATNRIDILDEALLRPGRFDRHIEVTLPDRNARYKILKLYSTDKLLADDADLEKVAVQTVYFSGAKLESLMNEAAIIAAKRDAGYIEMCDIDKAFYIVLAGFEKADRSSMSINEKKITAYHEAGHALVTRIVAPENRITRITIIPSTKGIGGFSMNIPPDRVYQKKTDFENNIKIALAGRAAEELTFGYENITSGASNDIERATELMLLMFNKLGMNRNAGLLNYEVLNRNLGSSINNENISECKKEMDNMYENVINILKKNKDILQKIAARLIETETIDEDEFNNLVSSENLSI